MLAQRQRPVLEVGRRQDLAAGEGGVQVAHKAVTMLPFFCTLTGFGFGRLDQHLVETMPPGPMGYFTRPPMLASGLTFCRHSVRSLHAEPDIVDAA